MKAPSGDQLRCQCAPKEATHHRPQSSEECRTRAALEGLAQACDQTPIFCTPNLDCLVIRLSCQELADWIPRHALDEPLMSVNLHDTF